MKVIGYLRFSTDRQDELQQLNTIQNYVNQKGMRLDQTYTDAGVSGGVAYVERNLFDLLNEINEGDTLILSELSRLSRNGVHEVSSIMQNYFKPNKLRLIICNEGLDIDCSDIDNNPMAEMQLSMLAIFAKMERQLLKKRISSRHEVNKKHIAEHGYFENKEGMRFANYAEAYGRKTGTTHSQALEKARAQRSINKRNAAKENPNNRKFYDYVLIYEENHGRVTPNTDVTQLTDELNRMRLATATGMEFNNQRTRSMLNKVRELYAV